MVMKKFSRTSLVCAFVALSSLAGCNEAADPINRVQANVVEKDTFEGEWYYLQTVIDTPYDKGYSFVGEQGSLEKISWEIQEEFLIARRSYQHIENAEQDGIAEENLRGVAIAMYRIQSHFDIRRAYNTVTGEEQNVIMENTSDRPWYEREFMRVDWSQNLITNNDFLLLAKLFNGIQMEPVSYFVQDLEEDHPHAPKFEAPEGSDEVNYIDLVNKMFVRPETVMIPGFDQPIPSCFLIGSEQADCAPGELTVRNSFLKVDSERDYQPQEYTGDRMERFGYFVTDRMGYNDEYGVVQPARFRFANRHNIWVDSHIEDIDDDGKPDYCGEDAHCPGAGSVCDLDLGKANRWVFADSGKTRGLCTVPYVDREIRPITYHLSQNFPEELLPDAHHFEAEWNSAFVDTVASLRENECLKNGGSADDCAAQRSREDHQSIFALCNNPVTEDDHPACGPAGTSADIGDLRYSLLGWVNEPHLSSPLGYGPSAADPETGEIVMANAFVYGAGVERLSAFARDIIAVLNGDLDAAQITNGEQIADWVQNQQAPPDQIGRAADEHHMKIDGHNVHRINEAMDFSWAKARGISKDPNYRAPQNIEEFLHIAKASREALFRGGAFGRDVGAGSSKLKSLRDTDIEDMMTNGEMLLAAGIDPRDVGDRTDSLFDQASPLRQMDPHAIFAFQRMKDRVQEEACLVHADFADDGLIGLARAIVRAANEGDGTLTWYGVDYTVANAAGEIDYEAVRKMLIHPMFNAVTAHEIGHTLGLRHNFSGSFDSLNYKPEYWELRDDGNMQPRYLDPTSLEEEDGRIKEYQYSTVMDYGNNFVVTDAEGIGYYDTAAIKMGYGDLIEVFTEAKDAGALNWVHAITRLGWPIPLKLSSFTGGTPGAYTYTEIPELAGGVEGLKKRADVTYADIVPDPFLQQQGLSDRLQDAQGRPVVPYMFCSDEQADLNPDCFRYDSGADAYESLQSVMDNYYNYYIFNAYGRGRVGFNVGGYANRVADRYFKKIKYTNQIYSLYRGLLEDIFGGGEGFDEFWVKPDGMGAWTAAVGAGFGLLTTVVTTPEPGTYTSRTLPDGSKGMLVSTNPFGASGSVGVDNFVGRPLSTTWDFDLGYYWFDQVDRAGYFYDKAIAIMMLTDPRTNFVGRDTSADVRQYALSYYTSFPDSMTSFLRAAQSNDWQTLAPRVKEGSSLVFPDALDLQERDMDGTPIDPNISFTIQLYAAVYGQALIPETYDESYLNNSRIFVKGSPNGVEFASGTPVVEFTDPESGLTYVAQSVIKDGKQLGVGAQMIEYANALKAQGSDDELGDFVDNMDLARRISWLFTFGG